MFLTPLQYLGKLGNVEKGRPERGKSPAYGVNICKVSGVGGTGQATFVKSSNMSAMCLNAPEININNKNKRRKP